MNDFRFLYSDFYYLLGLILFLWILFLFLEKRSIFQMKSIFKTHFSLLTSNVSFKLRYLKMLLSFFSVLFLCLSLLRPQYGKQKKNIDIQGLEILILFDVSRSMDATDIKASRLEYGKRQLKWMMNSLSSHRIGLIAFAGNAFLLSPLTSDQSSLNMYLDSINTQMMSSQGTRFFHALNLAKKRFLYSRKKNPRASQLILIFSDGEDDENDALKIASDFKKMQIPIYSIALGSLQGGLIPLGKNSYHKDQSGKVVRTQLNKKLLEKLAQISKGDLFIPEKDPSEWLRLLKQIESLEKNKFGSYDRLSYEELYFLFLILSLIFLFLDLFISDGKTASSFKENLKWEIR